MRFLLSLLLVLFLSLALVEGSAAAPVALRAATSTQAQSTTSAEQPSVRAAAKPANEILAVLTFGIAAGLAIWLGAATDLLRDGEPTDFAGAQPSPAGKFRRPYSLAQTQMAWWFAIIAASYLYVYLSRWSFDGILNETSLWLLGIGTGTALGAAIVDQTKSRNLATLSEFTAVAQRLAAAKLAGTLPAAQDIAQRDSLAPQLASEGLFRDILTDVDGVCLHRFQSVFWTVLLGILFAASVCIGVSMPKFDNLTLALLGISGGTYLGFKVPEQPA